VQGAAAETVDYAKEAQSGTVLGHKAVYINFASGSDQPLPDSIPTLNELKDSLAINSQLALQIDGYTDNAGSDAVNVPLSGKRAQAVKSYFQKVAPLSFPDSRFKSVAGHGSREPHRLERIGRRQGAQPARRDHSDRSVVSIEPGRRKPPRIFHPRVNHESCSRCLFTECGSEQERRARLVAVQVVIVILLWFFSPFVLLPKPGEVLNAFGDLWEQGLGAELITSFYLNVQAIACSTVVSLLLAYATVMPFFRPIVALLSKLRFLSLVGLTFFFTLMARSGHELKLSLLVFSVSVFL
jgi:hypothetical protein